MRKVSVLREKSFLFAVRIVKLYQYLYEEKKEYVLSKQLLRSGTAIGALVRESENAASRRDFINKLTVGLKEADETKYWLELMNKVNIVERRMFNSFCNDCEELIKLLIASIKTAKSKL